MSDPAVFLSMRAGVVVALALAHPSPMRIPPVGLAIIISWVLFADNRPGVFCCCLLGVFPFPSPLPLGKGVCGYWASLRIAT